MPFEQVTSGDGHAANQPLSMHSEMMAIYSALSASSTMSSTTFARGNPCFKLPRGDKRKARLRREVLMAFKTSILKPLHLNQVLREVNRNSNEKKEVRKSNNANDDAKMLASLLTNRSLTLQQPQDGEQHRQKKNPSKNGKKKEDRHQHHQHDRHASQPRQHERLQVPTPSSTSNSKCSNRNAIRGPNATTTSNGSKDDKTTIILALPPSASHQSMARKKAHNHICSFFSGAETFIDENQSRNMYGSSTAEKGKHTEVMLLPIGHTVKHSATVTERKKHPRLQSADLYVTRLGRSGKSERRPKARQPACPTTDHASTHASTVPEQIGSRDEISSTSISTSSNISVSSSPFATGSLHDELLQPEPSPNPSHKCSLEAPFDRNAIHASRPRYRCIMFMYSVGIRRVFWTNDAGQWEGEKFAKLVEVMDSSMAGSANDGGPIGNGVFVTKHEVLMLKRAMGRK